MRLKKLARKSPQQPDSVDLEVEQNDPPVGAIDFWDGHVLRGWVRGSRCRDSGLGLVIGRTSVALTPTWHPREDAAKHVPDALGFEVSVGRLFGGGVPSLAHIAVTADGETVPYASQVLDVRFDAHRLGTDDIEAYSFPAVFIRGSVTSERCVLDVNGEDWLVPVKPRGDRRAIQIPAAIGLAADGPTDWTVNLGGLLSARPGVTHSPIERFVLDSVLGVWQGTADLGLLLDSVQYALAFGVTDLIPGWSEPNTFLGSFRATVQDASELCLSLGLPATTTEWQRWTTVGVAYHTTGSSEDSFWRYFSRALIRALHPSYWASLTSPDQAELHARRVGHADMNPAWLERVMGELPQPASFVDPEAFYLASPSMWHLPPNQGVQVLRNHFPDDRAVRLPCSSPWALAIAQDLALLSDRALNGRAGDLWELDAHERTRVEKALRRRQGFDSQRTSLADQYKLNFGPVAVETSIPAGLVSFRQEKLTEEDPLWVDPVDWDGLWRFLKPDVKAQDEVTGSGRAREVSVVIPVRNRLLGVTRTIISLLNQSLPPKEIWVVDDSSADGEALQNLESLDPRVHVLHTQAGGAGRARNLGLQKCTCELVAFVDSDTVLAPWFLEQVSRRVPQGGWAYSNVGLLEGATLALIGEPFDEERFLSLNFIDQGGIIVSRELAVRVGGNSETLRRAIDYDFALRLIAESRPVYVPVVSNVGTTLPGEPRITHSESPSWSRHVVNRARAWNAPMDPLGDASLSIVVPTIRNEERLIALLKRLRQVTLRVEVEIIAVNDGFSSDVWAAIECVAQSIGVRTASHGENLGFASACNTGALLARGEVLLFLNDDCVVAPEDIERLYEHFLGSGARVAQAATVVGDTMEAEALGICFPEGGIPYAFARGLQLSPPLLDQIANLDFQAVNGAALLTYSDDFRLLKGFDPLFENGMEDTDFGLRHLQCFGVPHRVLPEVVIHHRSVGSGEARTRNIFRNRTLFMERWGARLRSDDQQLWSCIGYEVEAYRLADGVEVAYPLPIPRLVQSGELRSGSSE